MSWFWPELWLFLVLFAWWLWGLSLTIRALLAMANARLKKRWRRRTMTRS